MVDEWFRSIDTEELTCIKGFSALAVAAGIATGEVYEVGRYPRWRVSKDCISTTQSRNLKNTMYRFWYLCVLAVNKAIEGKASAVDYSVRVEAEVLNIAAFRAIETDGKIDIADGKHVIVSNTGRYSVYFPSSYWDIESNCMECHNICISSDGEVSPFRKHLYTYNEYKGESIIDIPYDMKHIEGQGYPVRYYKEEHRFAYQDTMLNKAGKLFEV